MSYDENKLKVLKDKINSIDGGHAWAADSKTFFYTRQDPETLRSFQVWSCLLYTSPSPRDKRQYRMPSSA